MLHQPAHATLNNSAHAVDGTGKVYFNDFERLVKERLARRHGQAAQQHSARPPLADQKNPASDNYALFGVQESRSLLGKRKAADVHTDDHDHEHAALNAADDACTDYQTCEDLWDALSSALASSRDATCSAYVNFRGSYALVADPKTPPRRRVELVSKDLRRFAKLPHSETRKGRQQHRAGYWTETYTCECSRDRIQSRQAALMPRPPVTFAYAPSPSTPDCPQKAAPTQASQMFTFAVHAPPVSQSISVGPLKRTPTQSTLAGWLTGTSKAKKTPSAPAASAEAVGYNGGPASCGGQVHITVEEAAHPLGYFIGHKVTVVLEHP